MPDKFITLPQLTKSVKGLVNRINTEITIEDSKIGDLSNLTTSATGNLVAAINSITANSGTTDLSNYVQKTFNESGNTGGVNYIFTGINNGITYENGNEQNDSFIYEVLNFQNDSLYLQRDKSDFQGTEEVKRAAIYLLNDSYDNDTPSIELRTSVQENDDENGFSETEYSAIVLNSQHTNIQAKDIRIGGTVNDLDCYVNFGNSFEVQTTNGIPEARINNLRTPTSNYQAANKYYVDQKFNNITYPVTSVNGATGAVTITATGIGALPDSTVIPTKTSDLTNDSKYLSGDINSQTNKDNGYIIFRQASSLQTGLTKSLYIGSTTNNNQFLQIGRSHTDDGIKGQIQLSNEAYSSGYTTITPSASYNITITLPNTTGTLALTSQVVSSVNGSTGTVIIDKIKTTAPSNNVEYNLMGTTSNNNTTAVSSYNQDLLSFAKTNDLSRLTIGSTATPGVVRVYTSAVNGTGFTDIKSNASSTNERTITLPDASGTVALTTDIPSVPSWALASSKPSYTFSELTSHPTTLNDYGITNAYTKTEVDGLVSGVLHYKGAKSTTGALPSSGNITGDVWHVTADGSEWAWDGSTWQELGTTVDLSGYLQTGDIAAWAKAANKPSYTASEVGALPSSTSYVSSFNGATGAITYVAPVTSVNGNTGAVTITAASITAASATHAHGNITSGGDMTATAAIANGDRLIINDESASKLVSSTITFGSSTAQYLANNGTWQNIPTRYNVSSNTAGYLTLADLPIYDGSISNLS